MKNILLGTFLIFLLLSNGCSRNLLLIEENRPSSIIVISKQATKEEEKAAQILQSYIYQISGAKLPIEKDDKNVKGSIISVGNTKLLPPDIREKLQIGKKIPITNPSRDSFVISSREDKLFLVGHRGEATIFSVYDFLESLGCRWFFACKAGEIIPHLSTMKIEKQDIFKTPDFAFRYDFSWDSPGRREEITNWKEANKLNRMWLPGVAGHNFHEIWPESLFKEHPEYFPLVAGKRVQRGQRCLSNPDVIKLGIEWADKTLRENPNSEVISLIVNDGETGFCQCENCKKIGNFADQIMYMSNEVGKVILKKYPDKMIYIYSYFESARSPHIKADGYDKNQDRIIVTMFQNFAKEPFDKLVVNWALASHHLNIAETWPWLYWSWGMRQGNPVSHIKELKKYPFYKKNNSFGISTQVCGDWARNGLSRYLSAKVKWNIDSDLEKLKWDFCEKMFPGASNEFYNYIGLYDEFSAREIDLKVFLQKGFYFLDQIRHKIKTDEERERWEFFVLYLHERTMAYKFDAIDLTDKKAKARIAWQMISFLKGIEDWGVLDSNNWIKTFYVEMLRNDLEERPSGGNCPEMPAMEINSEKIKDFFEHDRLLFMTAIPIMQKTYVPKPD